MMLLGGDSPTCRPGAPFPAADFHQGAEFVGVRSGGKRVHRCPTCEREIETGRDDPAPIPPQETDFARAAAPEILDLGGAEGAGVQVITEPSNIEPLPGGKGANQVLLDALRRVQARETQFVAIVEIDADGTPDVTWSEGPIVFPLAAAQALALSAQVELLGERDDDDEDDDA